MSTDNPQPPQKVDRDDDDPHKLARMALARAKDTARNRGFRTRTGTKRQRSNPHVTPGEGRDPVFVHSAVDRLVAMMGWRSRITVASVLGRWNEIVGEDIASHCRPERFVDGELTIQANSTAWATQLRYLLPQVERRLAEELGEGVVSKIHIRGPNQRKQRGQWRVSGRGQRDTWG